jgi:hypothetical protein
MELHHWRYEDKELASVSGYSHVAWISSSARRLYQVSGVVDSLRVVETFLPDTATCRAPSLFFCCSINCALWAQRTSKTTGKAFTNVKMNEHITRCSFGKNDAGHDIGAQVMAQLQAGNAADMPAAAAAAIAAAVAAPAAAPQRPGTYVDGIRIPWWMHDARVHDSDAGILHRKDPVHYKHFAQHAKQHEEYIWPRDIEPYHPEQKDELDALAAIVAQEEEEAQAKKDAKQAEKQKQKKQKSKKASTKSQRKSSLSNPMESDEEKTDGEENGDQSGGDDSAEEESSMEVDTQASSASTPKKHSRPTVYRVPADSPAAASLATTAASPVSSEASPPSIRSKRSRRSSLSDATSEVLNAQLMEADSPQSHLKGEERGSVRKRRKTASEDGSLSAKKPRARRKIQL